MFRRRTRKYTDTHEHVWSHWKPSAAFYFQRRHCQTCGYTEEERLHPRNY